MYLLSSAICSLLCSAAQCWARWHKMVEGHLRDANWALLLWGGSKGSWGGISKWLLFSLEWGLSLGTCGWNLRGQKHSHHKRKQVEPTLVGTEVGWLSPVPSYCIKMLQCNRARGPSILDSEKVGLHSGCSSIALGFNLTWKLHCCSLLCGMFLTEVSSWSTLTQNNLIHQH